MTKHIIFLLTFTLFFTACVERGQILSPDNTSLICTQKAIQTVPAKTKEKKNKNLNIVKIKKPIQENVIENKPSLHTEIISQIEKSTTNTTSSDNESFFTFTEETKNKISGFFIIAIGIMILL